MKSILYALTGLMVSAGAVAAQEQTQSTGSALRAMLAQADEDGDGVISREEFVNARARMFPGLDTDESGGLSKDEFIAALTASGRSKFIARRAFGIADTDDDGNVVLEEWNALPPRAFDRADKDKDGTLSSQEIEEA